jgi:hypothetical protein
LNKKTSKLPYHKSQKIEKSADGRNNINTAYSNEPNRDPVSGRDSGRRRGLQIYTLSQIVSASGRFQDGQMGTWGVEQPYFFLTPMQRNEIFKLSTPVFGVVTSRMNRISGIDFNIEPIKHREDEFVDDLKNLKQIYDEYANAQDLKYITVRAQIVQKIMQTLPDVLPDLSNFSRSLLRWKKLIQNKHIHTGDEIKEWLMEPNNGVTWTDYIKKVVFNLLVHGAEATYKQYSDGKLENFDSLPGGTVYRFKSPYFTATDGYIQMVAGYEPQLFFANECMFIQYLPVSVQNYPMIPLEALINKIAEGLLFDRLMAEQADGTKFPEKLVIVTNNKDPFGDFDKETEIPMNSDEQKRIETKINEPRKGAIITMTGNDAKLIDLSKENTMASQMQRQKDIREEVALVFNMSNMEVNLSGGQDTSGRATSESQSEIEQGKGITPLLKLIEISITKNILPFRFGYGYHLEFTKSKNELVDKQIDAIRIQNGEITVNELREENNQPTFDAEQFNLPRGAQQQAPGQSEIAPMYTKQIQ